MDEKKPKKYKIRTKARTVINDLIKTSDKEDPRIAVLIVIHGQEIGRRYLLNEASLVIGRETHRSDLIVNGEHDVSSAHAKLTKTGETYYLHDLDSLIADYNCNFGPIEYLKILIDDPLACVRIPDQQLIETVKLKPLSCR